MNILVINAGSSSLKYQLFNMETEAIIAKGMCDRIGIDGHLKHTPVSNGKPVFDSDIPLPTHAEAISAVIEKLTSAEYGVVSSLSEIRAIGHRVVHGGSKFFSSVLLTDDVIDAIRQCAPLAPLHVPPNLMGIEACKAAMPSIPQIAVFDTAFHHTIPDYAYICPIPYKYYEEFSIRRYGFHGTSHRYVSDQTIEYFGGEAEDTRIITCHLGNGSSLAAVKDGHCIETTMGVTPLEGVPMGTRSGTVDPSLVAILSELNGDLPINKTMNILNKESGVLGVSGISSDFRDIESAAGFDIDTGKRIEGKQCDPRAKLAIDMFCYHVAKFIGSFFIIMGGVDAVVFTAGIGENSPTVRRGICNYLEKIGIKIDKRKNRFRGPNELVDITGKISRARVLVIPTNEELVIARDTKVIVDNL